MKSLKNVLLNLFALAVLCLPALSWSQSYWESDTRRADTYRRNDAMAEGTVEQCKVMAVRQVTLEGGTTARVVATAAGGLVGGALASRHNGNYAAAALGALVGGAGGNAIAQKFSDEANEFILNCGGRPVSVVQEKDASPLPSRNAEVFLIRQQGRTRIVL